MTFTIKGISAVTTQEVVNAIKVEFENGKKIAIGFSSTSPDFMIRKTNGTVAATTKLGVIKSMTGIVAPSDLKRIAEEMEHLRPVKFGKSTLSVNANTPAPKVSVAVKSKHICTGCGVQLSEKVAEFCNRKMSGKMVCFTCQQGPKPKVEGASEASAPTPTEISTSVAASEASVVTPSSVKKGTGDDSCPRCGGSGFIASCKHVHMGACFKCNPPAKSESMIKRGTPPKRRLVNKELTTDVPEVVSSMSQEYIDLVNESANELERLEREELEKIMNDPDYGTFDIVMPDTDVSRTTSPEYILYPEI